jgi:hypothetical protein
MPPRLRLRFAVRGTPPAPVRGRAALIAALAVAALLVAGCGSSFDPSGACTADGSAPGAYPDLEAAVPSTLTGSRPNDLDSGRSCTPNGLGTLASHGVNELRFAGGTWERGSDSGVSLAVFTDPDGPPLQPGWVAEFYEAGARSASKVDSVEVLDYAVSDTVTGRRIDVLNGESYQTIVVWERQGQVAVALVANAIRQVQTKEAHEAQVRSAVEAFGA